MLAVITGAQRSGTSFLASFFVKCGFDLGTKFWHDEVDGGYENPDVCAYYREALEIPDFPFSNYWDMIEPRERFEPLESLGSEKDRIIKFSYLLMHPSILRIWLEERGDREDKFIILWRDTKDIVASKELRHPHFETDCDLLKQSPGQIELSRLFCYGMLSASFKRHTVLLSPRFIIEPENSVDMLQNLLAPEFMLPDDAIKIWYDMVDPSKIHFK